MRSLLKKQKGSISRLSLTIWRWPKASAALIITLALVFTLGRAFLPGLIPAHAGTQIGNSLRFTSGSSQYLSRTPGAASNRKTWTYSAWVKRSALGATRISLLDLGTAGSDSTTFQFDFNSSDQLRIGGGSTTWRVTTPVFRDPSAWMQVVLAIDTTQAVAANRIRLYINGAEVTAFGTNANPSQNLDLAINNNVAHFIGKSEAGGQFADDYLSDVYLIDGQQLTPSSFAEQDSTTGAWQPKSYSGSFGTNGFHLTFSNNGALGADVSGNGSTWTANNFASIDQVKDTPTSNFPTLNVLNKDANLSFSEGNTRYTLTSTGATLGVPASVAFPKSGKWYVEVTNIAATPYYATVGIADLAISRDPSGWIYNGNSTPSGVYDSVTWSNYPSYDTQASNTFTEWRNAVASQWAGMTSPNAAGDVLMMAYDADNGKLWFGKNGTWWNTSGTANPATGVDPHWSGIDTTKQYVLFTSGYYTPYPDLSFNFGQLASSTGSGANTYYGSAGGYFKYQPPTGFKALSTTNLPTPAIQKPSDYFDAATYTGTGAAQSLALGHAYGTAVTVYLTSGPTWTVPADFNPLSNTIETIGGGGGGGAGQTNAGPGGGGGGGAYAKSTNVGLTPGGAITYTIGSGGPGGSSSGATGTAGGDTYICNSTSNCASISGTAVVVGAKGGGAGGTGNGAAGSGGSSASGVGSTQNSGGNGGSQTGGGHGAAGGGGAGGPNGAGANGGYQPGGNDDGGGGGGGNGGGSAGSNASVSVGGNGGNNSSSSGSGSGGSAGNNGSPGSNGGGGGGGGQNKLGGAGGNGIDWDSTHGSGGGGGGSGSANASSAGGSGGLYGGGGGGGGAGYSTFSAGAAGAQGIIRITYTSTGRFNFTPTLTWIKDRTTTNAHGIFDSVRSVFPYWSSNANTAETASASTTLTAFVSNGFVLGGNSLFNTNGNSYISWNWKKSATAGVDIVTYEGDNTSNRNISHSLGAAPEFVMVKRRDSTGDPYVWHTNLTGATYFLKLDSTAAQSNTTPPWGTGNFSSTQFMVSNGTENVNASGASYVAYLFRGIDGYSKFGTYSGNSSTDGAFVYTGFRPRYVMIKSSTDATGNWVEHDSARDTGNPASTSIFPGLNNAEQTSNNPIDILSNGFKVRSGGADSTNVSGNTYVYAAFADIPFQQSAQPYNLTIATSTRFISGNSDSLSKTFGSAGNRQTWTWSGWIKRASLGASTQMLFSGGTGGTNTTELSCYIINDTLKLSSSSVEFRITSALFRDPAKWHHIVVTFDTTQATGADRIKIYADGQRITSFSTSNDPAQNTDYGINQAQAHYIGRYVASASSYYDGYMSDAYFIDGQALDPTAFGEYDTNGFWRPKSYSGTYGTNGFHLPLMGTSTASGIGLDTSGNNNTFTVSGITTSDFVKDSPTNSYLTLSTLVPNTLGTVLGGNIEHTAGTTAAHKSAAGPALPRSGKWYWEVVANSNNGGSGNNMDIGVADLTLNPQLPASGTELGGRTGADYIYRSSGTYKTNNASSGSPATYTAGDTIGVAWDADNGKIFFAKNGTWQSSGDPVAGTNPAFSGIATSTGTWAPADSDAETSNVKYYFGQGASTTMAYDSASGGYFRYTPPSGYKALSTANMATPSITKPNNYFDAITYTGTGATQSVTGTAGTVVKYFASSGTWTAPAGVTSVDVLVVAGGGGGGGDSTYGGGNWGGGGGGAGGLVEHHSYAVTPGNVYTVTVGNGGSAGSGSGGSGGTGGNSVFDTITAVGGGGGAGSAGTVTAAGNSGGSGGGAAGGFSGTSSGGAATQGNSGGGTGYGSAGGGSNYQVDGGGGGAGGAGGGDTAGAGRVSSITGNAVTYAAGGGTKTSAAGASNTGNGGAGGYGGGGTNPGGAGGSGVVIIKYTDPAYGFTPSLTWIKDRTTTNAHGIFDSIRAVLPYWSSNANTAETASASTTLGNFIYGGFTLGGNSLFNTSGNSYISWNWKKSATAGFDIVTYQGDNTSNRNISHSLGAAPEFVIVKRRDSTGDPYVWHTSLTGATYFTLLDSTAAQSNTNTPWGTGNFSSTQFMVTNNGTNNANASGATYVAYLFRGIDGYSKFGTYTGNASSDGPFVFTGFRPRYVLIKYVSAAGNNWATYDSVRDPFNVTGYELDADRNVADNNGGGGDLDFLSNGFKIRRNSATFNASGGTYIYAAFADTPFKYASAGFSGAPSSLFFFEY